MDRWMPSHRFAPAPAVRRALPRGLALAGVVAATAAAVLLPSTVASADTGATTTVVGRLTQTWADDEHSGTAAAAEAAGPQSFVVTSDGTSVPVVTGSVAGVPLDATVSVTVGGTAEQITGTATGDSAAAAPALPVLDSTIVKSPPPPAVVPARRFTNQVTVATVIPAGSTSDGTTAAQVADLVDHEVADFWSAQTDGAVRIGVTKTIDGVRTTAGCSKAATLWNEVAATVKFTAGPGKHLLIYLPRTLTSCAYALAEVG